MTEELEKCDSQLLMAQQEMRRLDFDWHDTQIKIQKTMPPVGPPTPSSVQTQDEPKN